LCHRWLPDGEKDAIRLEVGAPDVELRVWFERRGVVANGFIVYDRDREEIDPEVLSKQAKVEAGPFRGLLKLHDVSEDDLKGLAGGEGKEESGKRLGKRVVKLVTAHVGRFLQILRVTYGQYWLRPPEKWDSRQESLGGWCYRHRMMWSADEGKTWEEFVPDHTVIDILHFLTPKSYAEYLTSEKWEQLADFIQAGYEPSPAAVLLARGHELKEDGQLRYSLDRIHDSGEFVGCRNGPRLREPLR
jgi:hypothetical protein